uniref:Acetyltransferase n=1 Tax=Aureoumbra lagunensis TaxID=44058 RepID=A0A7S3K1S2_9STRA|mmetsp:Transcript_21704/g.28088  ORF Transcript_21704/g.28088 Transcript_21704/m.28088 type:complete len:382 (+) Transcript_21704:14-1159(+)
MLFLVLFAVVVRVQCLVQCGFIHVEVAPGVTAEIHSEEEIKYAVEEFGLVQGNGCTTSNCVSDILRSRLQSANELARKTLEAAKSNTIFMTELTMEPYRGEGIMSIVLSLNSTWVMGLKAMGASILFITDAFEKNVSIQSKIVRANLRISQSWHVKAFLFNQQTKKNNCPNVLLQEMEQYKSSVVHWQPARNFSHISSTGYSVRLEVGRGSYNVDLQTILGWDNFDVIKIGNFSSIAKATFILGGNHRSDWTTTFPFPDFHPTARDLVDQGLTDGYHVSHKGNLTIGSDVWICAYATILGGITIHHGAVVAAGAVVTKDVLPYSVVAGNPARHVKFRFNQSTIDTLLELRWWEWPDRKIINNFPLLLRHPAKGLPDYQHAA